MKNLVLCGFMGTGKTKLGRALAKRFSLPFVDIDEEIKKKTGMDIARIFFEKGEAFFRDIEEEFVREYGQREGMIISIGGGALQRERNVEILKNNGFLVCLFASPKAILHRLKNDQTRPLLQVENKLERIETLLKTRFKNYLKADAFLDTSYMSISLSLSYLESLLCYLTKPKRDLQLNKTEDRWVLSAVGEEELLRKLIKDRDISVRFTSAVRLYKKGLPLEELKPGRNLFLKWLKEEAKDGENRTG